MKLVNANNSLDEDIQDVNLYSLIFKCVSIILNSTSELQICWTTGRGSGWTNTKGYVNIAVNSNVHRQVDDNVDTCKLVVALTQNRFVSIGLESSDTPVMVGYIKLFKR